MRDIWSIQISTRTDYQCIFLHKHEVTFHYHGIAWKYSNGTHQFYTQQLHKHTTNTHFYTYQPNTTIEGCGCCYYALHLEIYNYESLLNISLWLVVTKGVRGRGREDRSLAHFSLPSYLPRDQACLCVVSYQNNTLHT